MSRDLRKLSNESKGSQSNQPSKSIYLELNKSSFTAASLPNPLLQPTTINANTLAGSASAKILAQMQGQESAVNIIPPSPIPQNSSPPSRTLKLSNGRSKVNSANHGHQTQTMGLGSFNIQERPASRMEINSLEGMMDV